MQYVLRVNGKTLTVEVDPDTPLLWVLRDELGLTGTKYGCGRAQCGACTVHVDGQTRRSCVLPISALGDGQVITIEGLDTAAGQAIQEAWNRLDVPQCGFCQSGQVMSASALLAAIPNPGDEEIDSAMAGNICRCATYNRIRDAIREAAADLGEDA